MTGTIGYDAAAEYVASQLRMAGLEPAGTKDYFQPVNYDSAVGDGEASRASLHRGAARKALAWKKDWVPYRRTVAARSQLRAPAVFVGYGITAPELGHDDYAGVDVRGKIAVMLLLAPKRFAANPRAYYAHYDHKLANALAHGAIGLVVIRDAHLVERFPWDTFVVNVGTVPNMRWAPPEGAAASGPADPQAEAMLSEGAAAALFEKAPQSHAQVLAADAAGAPVPRFDLGAELAFDIRTKPTRAVAPNVAGVLRGSDPALAAEYVVYSAHLDHLGVGKPVNGDAIYNGAYDNAMGVAMLLETARALAAGPRPRRSILFLAVGGEERGLLGSDYFARFPTVPIGRIVANVNLDMPLVLFPLADVVAFGAEHSTLGAVVEGAAKAEGLALAPDPVPDDVLFIKSDQYSFVRRGVPAVFLVSGFTSSDASVKGGELNQEFRRAHYHQPSDDLTRPVHWDSAVRFTRVNLRIGLGIANAAERPRWQPGNFFGERFGAVAAPATK